MILVAAMIKLDVALAVMDLAYFLMACCTMTALLLLSPRVKHEARRYFAQKKH